jgi:hypothetical protein
MIKRSNLRIHGVEEGAEIQNKDIENVFNDIIAEKFKYRRHLEIQTDMTRKEPFHVTL